MPARQISLRTRVSVDVAMVLLAVASVGLVVYEVLAANAELSPVLDVIDLAIVGVFITEFVWSARNSGNWRKYVRQNWYDIPGMIPITGGMVEAARGFRLLRLIRLIRLLRVIRAFTRVRRLTAHMGGFAQRAKIFYIVFVAVATVGLGGIAGFILENGANPAFGDLGDGLWWAFVTTTTVGYGDVYPITMGGRLVASILMLIGVGVIGTLAGSLGAALVTPPSVQAPERRRVLSRWHR